MATFSNESLSWNLITQVQGDSRGLAVQMIIFLPIIITLHIYLYVLVLQLLSHLDSFRYIYIFTSLISSIREDITLVPICSLYVCRREYRGGASQTIRSVSFCRLL